MWEMRVGGGLGLDHSLDHRKEVPWKGRLQVGSRYHQALDPRP